MNNIAPIRVFEAWHWKYSVHFTASETWMMSQCKLQGEILKPLWIREIDRHRLYHHTNFLKQNDNEQLGLSFIDRNIQSLEIKCIKKWRFKYTNKSLSLQTILLQMHVCWCHCCSCNYSSAWLEEDSSALAEDNSSGDSSKELSTITAVVPVLTLLSTSDSCRQAFLACKLE